MSPARRSAAPILLVDDEPDVVAAVTMELESHGIQNVRGVNDPRQVLGLLQGQEYDCVLLDLLMPSMDGRDLLKQITAEFPGLPVIIVTASDEIETAVECMRLGASDYLCKPINSSRLASAVLRALELREMSRVAANLRRAVLRGGLERPDAFSGIITRSPALRGVFQYVEAIGATSRPVLVIGETGTGKDLLARAVHQVSGRQGAFVAVNVAGLDDQLFSDTLFGHRRGAFTGADQTRAGIIEQAQGGTLFLDEIGDLSIASQVKLLRLIQFGEYYPLGADAAKRSDARIVCATHANLEVMLDDGRFRRDLYYRLRSHHVRLPPLRERLEDLVPLTQHFVGRASSELGREELIIPPGLYPLLGAYQFPGNVRELESMIFDAASRARGTTLPLEVFRQALGAPAVEPETGTPSVTTQATRLPTLKEAAQQLIEEALRRADGNQAAAAAMLGITRQALNQRLRGKFQNE